MTRQGGNFTHITKYVSSTCLRIYDSQCPEQLLFNFRQFLKVWIPFPGDLLCAFKIPETIFLETGFTSLGSNRLCGPGGLIERSWKTLKLNHSDSTLAPGTGTDLPTPIRSRSRVSMETRLEQSSRTGYT